MLGIKFKIPNTYDTILNKIFSNIDFQNCIIHIEEEEVLCENNTDMIKKNEYSSLEFKEIIKGKKYYPIFLYLQIYKSNGQKIEINSYNDFIKSECELVLFITDNEFVEIYSKKMDYLKLIEKNAKQNKFVNVEYINSINSIREKFSAYY